LRGGANPPTFALVAYPRAAAFPEHDKYLFSLYKLAWCYYNFSQRLSVYTTHTAAAVRRRAALRPDAHPLLAHPLLAETLLPPRYVVDGSALAAFEER
jgi:hypothetical protein